MSTRKEGPKTATSHHLSILTTVCRCLTIVLISATITVAIACQEQGYVGLDEAITPRNLTSCERSLQSSIVTNPQVETAETANQAIADIQEIRSEICDPAAWAPKVSAEPQSCHLSTWKDGTTTPPTLVEAVRTDTDGLTKDQEWNIIVAFAEKPTKEYEAWCWKYTAHDNQWTISLDE